MRPQHRWIAIYDIMDPTRLRAVAKLMESFGMRIQRSVFEIRGTNQLIDTIRHRLDMILEDVDSVVFIPLCVDDYEKTIRLGVATEIPETELSDEALFL